MAAAAMSDLIAALVPTAIGVALSPVGIIEMILVLFSDRAKTNGVVFLASVMVSVFLLPVVGALAFNATGAGDSDGGDGGAAGAWVLVIFGAALLVLAAANFRNRADSTPPAVLGRIATMGPGAVLVLSLGVVLLNPKNVVLLLSFGSQAAAAEAGTGALVIALVLLTLLATSPFIAVVAMLLWGGERGTAALDRFKDWLISRNRLIMAAVLGILGLVVFGRGLASLLG